MWFSELIASYNHNNRVILKWNYLLEMWVWWALFTDLQKKKTLKWPVFTLRKYSTEYFAEKIINNIKRSIFNFIKYLRILCIDEWLISQYFFYSLFLNFLTFQCILFCCTSLTPMQQHCVLSWIISCSFYLTNNRYCHL